MRALVAGLQAADDSEDDVCEDGGGVVSVAIPLSNGQPSPYESDFDTFMHGGYRDTPEWGMLLVDPAGNKIDESWSSGTMDISRPDEHADSLAPQP
jgi:hypothetical protein